MKKILFIDRDGTLNKECPLTYQIDSFDKLEFLPGLFTWLGRIVREQDFDLVMITNQDGLGTASFPEETFWPVHNFIIKALKNEGITFKEILIDKTLPEENAPTRKPGTVLLDHYIKNADLRNSWVIGDRDTDIQLARNLGCKSYQVCEKNGWEKFYKKITERKSSRHRFTSETRVTIELNLDGSGQYKISTGLNFFNHMLEQLARHSGIDLELTTNGDLQIDEHHSIEDTAIALGEAFAMALGNKAGINRYGFLLPMDDCLAHVAIDFGGRPWLVWDAEFKREKIGDMPTEMFYHFFKSFSDAAHCNLNIKAEGQNEHHKIESIFKAFAKSIKMAIKKEHNPNIIPTTKGSL